MLPKKNPGHKSKSKSRGTTSKSGKDRVITTFEVGAIPHSTVWPPVLKGAVSEGNALDIFSDYWGLEAKTHGEKGAKNPTHLRGISGVADAASVYKKQPDDPFWDDIRDTRWAKYLAGVDIESVSICALTGLPFIPTIDGDDLDHCESARRTSLMGIPISTFNCGHGGIWDDRVLVTHTIPEANRSAGEGSYFTGTQELRLGRLSMLLNSKAKLERIDGAILEDKPCFSLKHPFHEISFIAPTSVKRLISVVDKRMKKSAVLTTALKIIEKTGLDKHVNAHVEDLKRWPTLHGILEVINRQVCVDLNTLFTGARIQMNGTQLRAVDDILKLPAVGPDTIDLRDPHRLNRESKIYIFPPFGKINQLSFLAQRFENIQGSIFERILEILYDIGERKGLGQGKHWVSTYVQAEKTSGELRVAPPKPPPPPPKAKFDITNVEHLAVIKQNIDDWLRPNINGSVDDYLATNGIRNLDKYDISSRDAVTIKRYIRDILEVERAEMRSKIMKSDDERLNSLIRALEAINDNIGDSASATVGEGMEIPGVKEDVRKTASDRPSSNSMVGPSNSNSVFNFSNSNSNRNSNSNSNSNINRMFGPNKDRYIGIGPKGNPIFQPSINPVRKRKTSPKSSPTSSPKSSPKSSPTSKRGRHSKNGGTRKNKK